MLKLIVKLRSDSTSLCSYCIVYCFLLYRQRPLMSFYAWDDVKLWNNKGPSIYDIHTDGGGGQAQVDACGWGEGVKRPVDVTEN